MNVAVFGSSDGIGLQHVAARALVDTGATKSAITARIIAELGLSAIEKRPIMVATEQRLVNFYLFRVGLYGAQPGSALPYVFDESDGFQISQSHDFEVLLGMDILRHCDFSMTRGGSWQLYCG